MLADIIKSNGGLAVLLPDEFVIQFGIREGSRVDVTVAGDRVVLSVAPPAYKLADLLVGMTPEAIRDIFDWGDDKGRVRVEGVSAPAEAGGRQPPPDDDS